jgi:hypothetical protein
MHGQTNIKLLRQIFEKYPDIKRNENPFKGKESFSWDVQTDRQTEVDKQTDMKNLNSRFPQFCERA